MDRNARVLVVDDMSLSRITAQKHLTELGFKNITLAENGRVAWDHLVSGIEKKQPFEIVFSDWMMPELDGLSLFRKIKEAGWNKTPPFIMMTAESDSNNIVTAIKAGVAGYIKKPITLEALKEAIDNLANQKN